MKGVEKMIAKEEYQINIKLLEEEKDVNDFEKNDTSKEIKKIDIPLSLSDLNHTITDLIDEIKIRIKNEDCENYDSSEDNLIIDNMLYNEGYQKAEKKGKKKVKKIIKNLLKTGMSVREISKVTNYSEEDIRKIKE